MRKIYDVLLNLNKYAYEFYEWNKDDNIRHFKVINSYKVDEKVLNDLINYKFKVISNTDKICIFYDDNRACAFEFEDTGMVLNKSFMLFDEEEDVLNSDDDITDIKYKIINKKSYNKLYTRNDYENIRKLKSMLNDIKSEFMMLYIYYECFNQKEKNYKKAYDMLLKHVNNNNELIINKLGRLLHNKNSIKK